MLGHFEVQEHEFREETYHHVMPGWYDLEVGRQQQLKRGMYEVACP